MNPMSYDRDERPQGHELEEWVVDAYMDSDGEQVVAVQTYADRGILSSNAGLVVRLEDGREFCMEIVR